MKNIFTVAIIATVIGLGAGYGIGSATANGNEAEQKTSEHDSNDSHDHSHDGHSSHEPFEVATDDAPTVSVAVNKDAKKGYNLKLTTTNFEFSPENASSDNIEGEGHAHLYIDDVKQTRLYSNNFYLGELDAGQKVKVTLNTNDHKDYSVDGVVVADEVEIMGHSEDLEDHSEDSMDHSDGMHGDDMHGDDHMSN